MARLYIPEPQIDLYKDGFDEHDKLGRKATGQKLSDLVELIDDPMVIALDGAWGSGKSVFLKCWVGEHLKRDSNTTQTVYFDAFKHDYLDDPLIALTSAISERIERDPESKSAKAWRMAKNAAPFLGKAALRLGSAALVGKAISLTGDEDGALNDIGDKLAEEGGDIAKSLNEFWKKENGKRAAMEAFRDALEGITIPDEDGHPTQRLVVVIDELDRCRPDYALAVLEIMKHFFNVNGVHFVLGVNLKELQNSVRARYGAGSDAVVYLQKFVTISLSIERKKNRHQLQPFWSEHFDNCASMMKFPGLAEPILSQTKEYLKNLELDRNISLRDVERILTMLATIPFPTGGYISGYREIIAALAVLKHFKPIEYDQLRSSPEPREWLHHFNIRDQEGQTPGYLKLIQQAVVAPETLEQEDQQEAARFFDYHIPRYQNNLLRDISEDVLEVFEISSLS